MPKVILKGGKEVDVSPELHSQLEECDELVNRLGDDVEKLILSVLEPYADILRGQISRNAELEAELKRLKGEDKDKQQEVRAELTGPCSPLESMWATLEEHQMFADDDGYGESWREMCEKRTSDATWNAARACAEAGGSPHYLAASLAAWWAGWAVAEVDEQSVEMAQYVENALEEIQAARTP